MSAPHMPQLFLVDDHPLVRAGLAHLLEVSGFVVAGEAGSISETLSHPALAAKPLVIVDLSLGDESGIDLIKRLRLRGLSVLVYSMHEGSQTIRNALDAGAEGYVTKREVAQSLAEAIRAVGSGSRYLSPRAAEAFHEPILSDILSGRQLQLYQLLGQGCTNEEIARQLNISVRTLESYYVRVIDKLGVHGVKALRQQAIRDTRAME